MIGYPLDSHVYFETNGTPVYDRAITSAPLRKLYKSLFSDGILPNPSTNLQVAAGNGMTVLVQPGFAMCNGCLKLEEEQRTLAIQASDTTYDRIDTVVLRLNDNDSERICDLYIVQGVPASTPIRPTLTRDASIWELGLADLYIVKNSTEISNQRITDTRYETDRCGIISSISEFDTTTLYKQIQADLESFQTEEQFAFLAWFENIKNQLSEDAAGNLQLQIGTLNELETDEKTDIVKAVNEVNEKAKNGGKNLISDEFSEDKEYVTNDYCIRNNALYRFTDDKPAGVWDDAVAEITTVGVELSEQNKNLQGVKFNIDETGKIVSYTTETGGADSVFPFSSLPLNVEVVATYFTSGTTTYKVDKEGIYVAFQAYDPGYNYLSIPSSNTAEILLNKYVYKNDASAGNIVAFHAKPGDVIAITWGQILYCQSLIRISFS